VFAAGLSDHFRNRLTHTIEVSQVARTAALTLGLNEEYTETLALAHDLGHPPFGHVGETELDRQMRRFGSSFEHNRHALRIVDVLEERYARFDGLNLCFEVREGLIKHSREVNATDEPELQEFLPGKRPPLEAQLIDLADEIAYNTADLDDGFSAGVLSLDEIAEAVPAAAELTEQVDTQYPGASPRVRFCEMQRQLINILIGGLIEGTVQVAEQSGARALEDLRALDHRIANLTPEALRLNKQLKALLVDRFYSHEQLADQRNRAVKAMAELFEYLLQFPDQIPLTYRERLTEAPRERIVCDYIAGMTDGFLTRLHAELVGRPIRG
jgi:dGTPase